MSLLKVINCPICQAPVEFTVTGQLLEEAAKAGAARGVAKCKNGHVLVLSINRYGDVAAIAPASVLEKQDCEITDRAPLSAKQRLNTILERGPASESDKVFLEWAKKAGWVVC